MSSFSPDPGYRRSRRVLEQTIEELIELLNQQDGDPDFEEDDAREDDDPREADDPAEEDNPAEPSLASPERHDGYGNAWGGVSYTSSQTHWAAGSTSDRELTEDTQEGDPLDERGELDDSDEEPSLGWTGIGTGYDPARDGSAWDACSEKEQDCDREPDDQDTDGEFKGGTHYGADERAPHDCGGHTSWS